MPSVWDVCGSRAHVTIILECVWREEASRDYTQPEHLHESCCFFVICIFLLLEEGDGFYSHVQRILIFRLLDAIFFLCASFFSYTHTCVFSTGEQKTTRVAIDTYYWSACCSFFFLILSLGLLFFSFYTSA